MSDFLVDFRPRPERQLAQACSLLRFMDHVRTVPIDEPAFGLALTFTGDAALCAPYRAADGTWVAIAGRVSLAEPEWQAGERLPGDGGLAGKAVYQIFRNAGLRGLERLGGNCVILLFDPAFAAFHLVTDWAGAFPAFQVMAEDKPVFGSHPDVLAAAADERQLDEVSLTEFLLSSAVTAPFTYYEKVRALPHGTVTTIETGAPGGPRCTSRRYVEMSLHTGPNDDIDALAEELATAIRGAVRRRTSRRFGRTAVALSGGLDSRGILACIENRDQTFAFSCYDEPNRELAVARSIAQSVGVPFLPWRRDFEYYGETAELGVRISGAMGTLANNHFLGVVGKLRAEGTQNLLTGCYCDYLFKGLPLNRATDWLTGKERLAPFDQAFYFQHRARSSSLARQARDRWESWIPASLRAQDSDPAVFELETRRTFPLCYEPDNQQRVVPQRVTGWYLPVADRAILDVYRKIPWHAKLNRSVYVKAILKLCQGPLARVPDANTGAPVGASAIRERLAGAWIRAGRKLRKLKGSIATDGSWPDWHHYVEHSRKLDALWNQPNDASLDFFRRALNPEDVRPRAADYQGNDAFLLVSLLTLKLWFAQWHS